MPLISRMILAVSVYALAFSSAVLSLNCHICAETNLEEFGECKSPYKYNCDNYQKKHGKAEQVYCRTTRHRDRNGTYAVIKECIAESVHYSTFPQKIYNLEKECDVVDIDGLEVAYCVCRDQNNCNQAPIVEQFTSFEKEHPEYFDQSLETTESEAAGETESVDFANTELSTGTSRSPFDIPMPDETTISEASSFSDLSTDEQRSLASTATIGNAKPSFDDLKIANKEPLLKNDEQHQMSSGLSFGSLLGTLPALQCMQCTQAGLANVDADCQSQVVVGCPDRSKQDALVGRPLCFSRQIISPKQQIGVEKMCVTEKAVLEEFKDAAVELIRSVEDDNVSCKTLFDETTKLQSRFCICTSSKCNKPSVSEQMSYGKQKQPNGFVTEGEASSSFHTTTENPTSDKTASTNLLLKTSLSSLNPPPTSSRPSTSLSKKTHSPKVSSTDTVFQTSPKTFTAATATSKSATTNSHPSTTPFSSFATTNSQTVVSMDAAMNCAVCLDVNLNDPLEDCRKMSTQNCAHQIPDEQAFCLTRQTQNGKDAFIVEKSCVSASKFYSLFPEERRKSTNGEVVIGCASTYEGYVNYCLCETQMCNRHSIAQQADEYTKDKPGFTLPSPASSSSPSSVFDLLPAENNNRDWLTAEMLDSFSTTIPTPESSSTTRSSWPSLPAHVRIEDTTLATRKQLKPSSSSRTSTSSSSDLTTTAASLNDETEHNAEVLSSTSVVKNRLEKWKAATEATMHGFSAAPSHQHSLLVVALTQALLIPLVLAFAFKF